MIERKKEQEELIKIIARMSDEQCRRASCLLEDSEEELVKWLWQLSRFQEMLAKYAGSPSEAAFDHRSNSPCRQLNLLGPASMRELH